MKHTPGSSAQGFLGQGLPLWLIAARLRSILHVLFDEEQAESNSDGSIEES